jgi:adenosylcobinamide kinase/adenosylcobinamide-phosphate guanylyltransferase
VSSRRTLVTGGVRSGKSRHAETILASEPHVRYVAPGPVPDPARDPEWAARIEQHRSRRPPHWETDENADVAAALREADGAVLVDCLGTWVTAVVDGLGLWAEPLAAWQDQFELRLEGLVQAWVAATGPVVAVTNEVGWGVVPEHRSGRTFADLLGRTNQAVAAVSDEVVLLVAGRPLRL